MNIHTPRKKPTNLSLDQELIEEARELGINLSQAAETGLQQAVKQEKERQWLEENREALHDYNRWVEENGIPLEKYRQF